MKPYQKLVAQRLHDNPELVTIYKVVRVCGKKGLTCNFILGKNYRYAIVLVIARHCPVDKLNPQKTNRQQP